ncbi:MAG TPA: S-layer homology domain-containing protein, partial [Candidatus Evtepia excrementipullorum]|nr:S-layer homology domain-containing protein [Candidatus Evtepia excrementipullorum]
TWAVGEGVISGIGNNTLAPDNTASRAQMATVLTRYTAE